MESSSSFAQHTKYEPFYRDSRWAEENEFKDSFTAVPCDSEKNKTGGAVLYNDGKNVWVDSTDNHSLTVGATGSMKTRRWILATVISCLLAGESCIVSDCKAEIYERTSGLAEKLGYKINVLNLRDTKQSHKWNMLAIPYYLYYNGEQDRAVELIEDLAKNMITGSVTGHTGQDPFWDEQATCLCFSLMLLLVMFGTKENATVKSMLSLRHNGIDMANGDDQIDELIRITEKDSLLRTFLSSVLGNPERTRQCIFSTFDGRIRPFLSNQLLQEILSVDEIDISSIGEKKTITYIIFPDEKTTYNCIVTAFVKQIYETLIWRAQNFHNGVLPIRVNFILDEFAQIPQIQDFSSMVSAGRSRNIRFDLVIQSLHQLHSRYGADAETIFSQATNIVYLSSREQELLDRLSYLAGNGADGEALITPSQLQRLSKEKGEALVLSGRNYPFITRLEDIDSCEFPKYPPCPFPKWDLSKRAPVFDIDGYFENLKDKNEEKLRDISKALEEKFEDLFGASDDDGEED